MHEDEAPDVSEEAGQPGPPSPKRGAFPTPKAEIDAATPFVPDATDAVDPANAKPEPPTEVDEDQEDQEG